MAETAAQNIVVGRDEALRILAAIVAGRWDMKVLESFFVVPIKELRAGRNGAPDWKPGWDIVKSMGKEQFLEQYLPEDFATKIDKHAELLRDAEVFKREQALDRKAFGGVPEHKRMAVILACWYQHLENDEIADYFNVPKRDVERIRKGKMYQAERTHIKIMIEVRGADYTMEFCLPKEERNRIDVFVAKRRGVADSKPCEVVPFKPRAEDGE